MSSYQNDYHQTIKNAITILQKGGIILYPTDTVWGLGCDATNSAAVQRIYAIKKRSESKALITLLPNLAAVSQYVSHIPTVVPTLLANAQRPTTIIYPQAQRLASNLIADNGSIAIRLPQHDFCQQLLQAFGKPLVSTSANISGEPTPLRYQDISTEIHQAVDYVIDYRLFMDKDVQPSTILLINENQEVITIRA